MRVIQIAATALLLTQIGCATTSYRHFEHSDAEVQETLRRAEQEALAKMATSTSPDVAQAAQQLALVDHR